MSETLPEDFEGLDAVVRTDSQTIYVRPWGNCSTMNEIFNSEMSVGNVSTDEDGNIKINVSVFWYEKIFKHRSTCETYSSKDR